MAAGREIVGDCIEEFWTRTRASNHARGTPIAHEPVSPVRRHRPWRNLAWLLFLVIGGLASLCWWMS